MPVELLRANGDSRSIGSVDNGGQKSLKRHIRTSHDMTPQNIGNFGVSAGFLRWSRRTTPRLVQNWRAAWGWKAPGCTNAPNRAKKAA